MTRTSLIAGLVGGLAGVAALVASTVTADAGVLNRSNATLSSQHTGIVTVDHRRHGGTFHRPHFRPFWPSWRPRHHYWR